MGWRREEGVLFQQQNTRCLCLYDMFLLGYSDRYRDVWRVRACVLSKPERNRNIVMISFPLFT